MSSTLSPSTASTSHGSLSASQTQSSSIPPPPKAQELMQYLTHHELTQKLNDIVNQCVRARPDDPFSFMAAELHKIQHPIAISIIHCTIHYDADGQSTYHIDIYGKTAVNDHLLGSCCIPSSAASIGDISCHDIGHGLQSRFKGVTLIDQLHLDGLLSEINDQWIQYVQCSVSAAFIYSYAMISHIHPYQIIQGYYQKGDTADLIFPSIAIDIIKSRVLKYRGFGIIPLPYGSSIVSQLKIGQSISKAMEMNGQIGSNGVIQCDIKKIDDVIQLIEKTITSCGYIVGEQCALWVDVGATALYQSESAEYELDGGVTVTTDELFAQYQSMLTQHPAIIAIMDPFHPDDVKGWALFSTLTTSRPLPISSSPMPISGSAASVMLSTTISAAISTAQSIKESSCDIIVSRQCREGIETILSDFAVGVGARYVRFGSLNRGENIAKYNRLLQIDAIMNAAK